MSYTAKAVDSNEEIQSISADQAKSFMEHNLIETDTRFYCEACGVPFVAVAIVPRKEPYKVSPHFRLHDDDSHDKDCSLIQINTQTDQICKALGSVISRHECGSVPEVLKEPKEKKNSPGTDNNNEGEDEQVASPSQQSFGQDKSGKTPLTTSSLNGIMGFRNSVWNELRNKDEADAAIAEKLRQISLKLPSGKSNYSEAFVSCTIPQNRDLIYLGKQAKVFYDKNGEIILYAHETVHEKCRAYPKWQGYKIRVHIPFDVNKKLHSAIRMLSKAAIQRIRVNWWIYGGFSEENGVATLKVNHPQWIFFKPS